LAARPRQDIGRWLAAPRSSGAGWSRPAQGRGRPRDHVPSATSSSSRGTRRLERGKRAMDMAEVIRRGRHPLIHIATARPDSSALAGQPTRPDLPGPHTPAPGGRLATVL